MSAVSPREEIIKLQKQIYRKNQRLIQDAILVSERGFGRYESHYLDQVKTFDRPAPISELKWALEDAQWIYMGDYHTNRQAQRALLRALKLLVTRTDQFVLCLEFLQKKHQKQVDDYLRGRITTETFLKRINLRKHFHFDLWENFEPIFHFCQYYQIDIYGIESAPFGAGLKKRDLAMAQNIAEISEKNPGCKIFTFVGDLHIAPNNLPAQVAKQVGEFYYSDEELFLYQNSESIYWKLAESHMEDKVEMVKVDAKSYCLINTPPIIRQQSYLNWLENEEEGIDFEDPKNIFLELAEKISGFLDLTLPKAKEEVEVFTCGDFSFLERLKEDDSFTAAEKRHLQRRVALSQNGYIPKYNWVYLANMAFNQVAEEAAHFIRHLVSKKIRYVKSEDRFYDQVLYHALGFFGSKIINPKRKCLRLKDYRSMIKYFHEVKVPKHRSLDLEVALTVVNLARRHRSGKPLADPREILKKDELFWTVSRVLGYMLGEVLYYTLIQGKFKKVEVRDLFARAYIDEKTPWELYQSLIKRFSKMVLPERM